jgi:hypothetical protein
LKRVSLPRSSSSSSSSSDRTEDITAPINSCSGTVTELQSGEWPSDKQGTGSNTGTGTRAGSAHGREVGSRQMLEDEEEDEDDTDVDSG